MESIMTQKPHAVVLASPGMGHLTPLLELVKRLLTHHGFEVTLFAVIADSSSLQSQILSSTSTITNQKFLHVRVIQPDVSAEVPQDVAATVRLVVTMHKAMPLVQSVISSMKVCPDIFIADMFGTDYWAMADEFGMSKYVFITTSAWFLALSVYLPVFEKEVSRGELEGLDCIRVPGCTRVKKDDNMSSFSRDSGEYLWFVGVAKRIAISDGIIVNSWHDLEPKAIESLKDQHLLGGALKGQVYAVGPLVKQPPSLDDDIALPSHNQVLKWIDKQPDQSVLYVSFGSGGSLTYEQIQELAWGLEFSEQRFIWVLRPPLDKDDASDQFFFTIDVGHDGDRGVLDYLPAGFLARTKDAGLVLPMWAPQAHILGRKAIGGFLTHCGWNSIIESVVNGVPMIAWPLYAEQALNATMLTEDLKIAVKPDASPGKEAIGREEIEKAIRKIMADKGGKLIRDRVNKLKDGASKAGEAGIGSSYCSLSAFTKLCTIRNKSNKSGPSRKGGLISS